MDPVSTLSLVANIFGVIAFTKDVVSVASQIHDSGDSDQLLCLEQAAGSLRLAVTELNAGPNPSQPDQAPAPEDSSIAQIAQDIARTSEKITKLLDDVRGGKGRPWPSKLQTAHQTFKTIWNRRIIAELSKAVSDVQQSLHLNATVLIKAKLDKHAMRLEEAVMLLDVRTRDLLPSFLTNFAELSAKCDDILANQNRSEELAATRHREVLARFDTIRSGSPLSVVSTRQPDHEQIMKIEDTIIVSLWYPFLDDRQDMIHDAYKQTFEWIFRDLLETRKPWANFTNFLKSASAEILDLRKAGLWEEHLDEVHLLARDRKKTVA